MKKFLHGSIWLTALMLQGVNAPAQVWEEWVRFYHGSSGFADQALDLASDTSENIYVTGWSSGLERDYATVKYNAAGDEMWVARYEGPQADCALSVAVDAAGNIYVTGQSQDASLHDDCLTLKYDSAGIQQWQARFDGAAHDDDEAQDIALDSAGNCYVAGIGTNYGTGKDFLTIKYNANGAPLWAAFYDGPASGDDEARSIALDEFGNVFVAGSSTGLGTDFDYAIIKYDSTGQQCWVSRYNGPGNGVDWAYSLALGGGGFAYVTGMSWGAGGNFDCATIKYDPSGGEQWVSRFNGANNGPDKAYVIALDLNENVYIAGYTSGNCLTIRYSPDGIQQWAARYNGPADDWDEAMDMVVDGLGNATVAGRSQGVGTIDDFATVHYDSSGLELWVARYAGAGGVGDEPRAVIANARGDVYVTGFADVGAEMTDYCTIKYTQVCPLDITLIPTNPPIQIPAAGGDFDFGISLTNSASSSQILDFWVMTRLPNGIWHGPLLGPLALTLLGGASLNRTRWQHVPGSAPVGEYWYEGRVGDYPTAIWDTSGFAFTKSATGNGIPVGDWACTGESFEQDVTATASIPQSFALKGAHPNPFNPYTSIGFALPENSRVHLGIYDIGGRLVATLADGWREAGVHDVTFDGSNLASGVYVCRLSAGSFTASSKMVLMK